MKKLFVLLLVVGFSQMKKLLTTITLLCFSVAGIAQEKLKNCKFST
jgi:hypothetical protein